MKAFAVKTAFLAASISMLISASAKAEIGTFNSPSWQEVPNTGGGSNEQYSDPAYVDVNGIQKNGDIITYDLVGVDASYSRVEANCVKNQFRTIRQGDFISATEVGYDEYYNEPWTEATSSYHVALMSFICSM